MAKKLTELLMRMKNMLDLSNEYDPLTLCRSDCGHKENSILTMEWTFLIKI